MREAMRPVWKKFEGAIGADLIKAAEESTTNSFQISKCDSLTIALSSFKSVKEQLCNTLIISGENSKNL